MNLIVFALATIGLTNILVHGRILDLLKFNERSVREWMQNTNWSKELLECYECTGFWSGLICGLVCFSDWRFMLMAPFVGTVISPFYNSITVLISSKTEFVIDDEIGS